MLKKTVTLALSLVLVAALCTPGLTSSLSRQISVDYGISFQFNGENRELYDAAGNAVQPFAYNGTTYVPIRAVSNLFGADVGYDPASKSVLIYDDYGEVNAVANRILTAAADSFLLVYVEAAYALAQEYADTGNAYFQCIENLHESLALIELTREDNVHIDDIIDNILPAYNSFLDAFDASHESYEALRTNPTDYNDDQFVSASLTARDKYDTLTEAVKTYFDKYCWRDLDILAEYPVG